MASIEYPPMERFFFLLYVCVSAKRFAEEHITVSFCIFFVFWFVFLLTLLFKKKQFRFITVLFSY